MIRLGQLLHFHTRVSLVFLFFILTLFGGLTIYTAINVKAKLIREQALNWILINNSQIAELLIVDNRIGLNSILKSKNNEALSLFDNVIIDSKSAGLYSLDNSVHKGKCSLFYFICVEEDLTLGSFNLGSLIIIKSLIDRDLVIILGVIFTFLSVLISGQYLFNLITRKSVESNLIKPLEYLSSLMSQRKSLDDDLLYEERKFVLYEVSTIWKSYYKLLNTVREISKENVELEVKKHKYELAQKLAHDIRSPVSAINAFVSTIDVEKDKKDFLKHISNRINTIAEDLLDKNQISNVVSCKSVYGVIRNVVKEKRALYNSKVEFRLKNSNKVSTDSIHIKFNEADFARVLSNLINNSIEAIDKSKGLIEISCQANEDSLSITIRDNGIGMSEEVLSNLGKRGFSTGKKSSDSGSGIGVSSAIDILKAYGSTFQVNSQLSIGTEIEINIPYCGQNN